LNCICNQRRPEEEAPWGDSTRQNATGKQNGYLCVHACVSCKSSLEPAKHKYSHCATYFTPRYPHRFHYTCTAIRCSLCLPALIDRLRSLKRRITGRLHVQLAPQLISKLAAQRASHPCAAMKSRERKIRLYCFDLQLRRMHI
jgi:hypothetical protein